MAMPLEASWGTTNPERCQRQCLPISTDGDVPDYAFLDARLNTTGNKVASWASKTEQYMLQNMPEGKEGRGRKIQIVSKQLAVQTKTGKWRRHHWTFWQRLQDAVEQKPRRWTKRVMELLQEVENHWHHCEMAVRWVQGVDSPPIEQLKAVR